MKDGDVPCLWVPLAPEPLQADTVICMVAHVVAELQRTFKSFVWEQDMAVEYAVINDKATSWNHVDLVYLV